MPSGLSLIFALGTYFFARSSCADGVLGERAGLVGVVVRVGGERDGERGGNVVGQEHARGDRVGVGSGLLAFGHVQAPVGAKGGPCDQDVSCGLRECDGGRAPSAGAESLDGEG